MNWDHCLQAGSSGMWTQLEVVFFAVALVAQAAGLISVAIARLGQRPASRLSYERFFFICLSLVGVISMLAIAAGTSTCLIHGVTLALMALGATLDIGRGKGIEPSL